MCACHRGGGDKLADKPSSCVIEHDAGITQCFEDVGATAKKDGAKICEGMHGTHTFHAGEPCPKENVVGSCIKRAGTDLERTERCYHDEPGCAARCAKALGTYMK